VPSLHHLALRTFDLERLLAFYTTWLDCPIAGDQRPRSVWLAITPDARLMLERAAPEEPTIPARSLELVAFHVTGEERTRLRARLVAADMLEWETEHTLYTRDPDGRRVGFSSYPW
jgi:catechol 2,3-dioxygenase-like lactoylglutathione lyase family enzyme